MAAELDERDRALWAAVVQTVTPLGGAPVPPPAAPIERAKPVERPPPTRPLSAAKARPAPPQLDGGWERRLARGLIDPDRTVDLHGERLEGAWDRLDRAMDSLVGMGGRVLLVIAGKDRGDDVRVQPDARGRIRAHLLDWLQSGRHADRILAVRPAHARHGGTGAVYVLLRRTGR